MTKGSWVKSFLIITSFEGEGVRCPLMTIDDEGEGGSIFGKNPMTSFFNAPLTIVVRIIGEKTPPWGQCSIFTARGPF